MRGVGNIVGLLVVALIAVLVYKFYFQKTGDVGTATPMQTIDVAGVKNDLLAIAQAERLHQAQHGAYASLDELNSSGAMSVTKTSRDGYTYEVQTSAVDFHVIAHCPTATQPGCKDYSVGQSMEVTAAP
jgi:hypothetical protein